MILDIADEHEANTGRPQQGLVSAAHFFGLQAASAIVGLSAGFFLHLIEFPTGLTADEMPWEKIRSLALFVLAVIVVVGVGLAMVIRTLDVSAEKQASDQCPAEGVARMRLELLTRLSRMMLLTPICVLRMSLELPDRGEK